MYKIILKDKTEYITDVRPTENSISVLVASNAEAETFKTLCTKENLKEITFLERDGVYSVITDKEYAGKYSIEERENNILMTLYIKEVDKAMLALEEIKQGQTLQDNAILEIAGLVG